MEKRSKNYIKKIYLLILHLYEENNDEELYFNKLNNI